ncbi:MAG: lipoate--protein ligase [Bacteroidetes bacterium]|nr:lipoate--protein ligase [Bacteroidota bacterium]|tara:strand:+ start:161 stop:835 length:675 start_codon:yes stop_codon:yes gene_type:complete
MSVNVEFRDLKEIRYKEAWDYQEVLFKELLDAKRNDVTSNNYLLFCEHNPVFTLGKSGSESNLLMNETFLGQKGIEFFKINRGGDITYHGPGQIVGYPILDLEQFQMGVKQYIHALEEVIIKCLESYGVKSERLEGATGVWLDTDKPTARKICAIGVKASRYVSMHGFAFNINTDLNHYSYINPCGFTDKSVTSLQQELGREIDFEEAKARVKEAFIEVFGMQF